MTNHMVLDDLAFLLEENNWVVKTNIYGLWVVGPETEPGTINVLGMGRTFGEALEMARRSKEK